MYNVMIVDDEKMMRLVLRNIVNWEDIGFNIVDEAKDGEEALVKLSEDPSIDVVITDIQMPKMEGIELLEKIREKNLCPVVIILSGFSDFSYAQQALVLGAFDYILKPVESNKVAGVLRRACKYLNAKRNEEEKNETLKKKLEFNISISREKVLYNILRGKNLPLPTLHGTIKEFDLQLSKAMVQVAIIEIDDFDENAEQWVKDGKDAIFLEHVKRKAYILLSKIKGINYIIVEGDIGSLNAVLQPSDPKIPLNDFNYLTMNFFETLLLEISRSTDMKVTIGIGKAYERVEQVSSSYIDAKDALQHKYVLGGNRIIHALQLESNSDFDFPYPVEKEKLLMSYIALGDDKAADLAQDTFSEICEVGKYSSNRIHIVLSQVVGNLVKGTQKKYSYLSKIYELEKLANSKFTELESIDEMKEHFVYIITELLKLIKDYKLNCRDNIINKACEYVIQHVEEDISLQSLSKQFNVSKNYFCSLFKQETGENFLDYITKVKIERAKMLLKSENYKAYEISTRLGYHETGYFSRLFKKYTGYSPSEYRKSVIET